MRFHKAESAFFVFIFVILAAGLVTLHAYGFLQAIATDMDAASRIEKIKYLNRLLFATGVLLATALFFGVFFIYPLIRRQATEEGKLRAMTVSLSARSETLEHAALTDGLTGMQN
ncbi:MAG: GGDEF domain-containing protein, partial [Mesorhizobium sp.]